MRFSLIMLFLAAGTLCLSSCGSKKNSSSSSTNQSSSQSSQPSSQSSESSSSSQSSQAAANLIISEVVTDSNDDSYLEGNDWIELYNAGSQAVELSDYSLSDSADMPYPLSEMSLAPGAYVVIAAVDSEDLNPPPLNVPFKLGSEDRVQLHLDNEIVDSLIWQDGDIDDDQGFGLIAGNAQPTKPTPGEANQPPPPIQQPTGNSDLIVSEIVSKSTDDSFLSGNDWIELHNTGSTTIDLGQFYLADSNSERYPLPNVQIGAGEYWVVAAVDSDDLTPPLPNVPFKLGDEDSVLLYLNDELVDRLDWTDGDAPEGEGFGIVEDSATTTAPTPNAANQKATDPNPTGNSGLIINEIVAKSDNDNYLDGNDWIELYNAGSTVVDLSQFTLADSGSDAEELPNVMLQAGEYLVIAAVDSDDTDPPIPSVPFKLGSDDNLSLFKNGELVDYFEWYDGDAPEGSSYGIFADSAQTLNPTPERENTL